MVTEQDVLKKLKNYRSLVAIKKQLEYEIGYAQSIVSDDEVLLSAALSGSEAERVSGGRIPDRTFSIAASYKDEAEAMRLKHRAALQKDLSAAAVEINRLDLYIGLLDNGEREVVALLYQEGRTIEKTADLLDISQKTVHTRKSKAVRLLAEMYRRIDA